MAGFKEVALVECGIMGGSSNGNPPLNLPVPWSINN